MPALRRRRRWSNEQTLVRYVQESVFVQCSLRLPPRVSEILRRVSALFRCAVCYVLANPPEDYLTLEVVVHRRADDSSSDVESHSYQHPGHRSGTSCGQCAGPTARRSNKKTTDACALLSEPLSMRRATHHFISAPSC